MLPRNYWMHQYAEKVSNCFFPDIISYRFIDTDILCKASIYAAFAAVLETFPFRRPTAVSERADIFHWPHLGH